MLQPAAVFLVATAVMRLNGAVLAVVDRVICNALAHLKRIDAPVTRCHAARVSRAPPHALRYAPASP